MNTMSNNPFHPSNHLLVGNKAPYLLLCGECNCHDSVIIIDLKLPQMPWVTTLKCTKNNSHPLWFICKICNTQRNEFKNMKQLKSHHFRCHLPPKKNVEVQHVLKACTMWMQLKVVVTVEHSTSYIHMYDSFMQRLIVYSNRDKSLTYFLM